MQIQWLIVYISREFTLLCIISKMGDRKATYLCHVCAKVFYYRQNLNRHLLTHKNVGIECQKCGRKYKTSEARDKHLAKCQKKEQRKQEEQVEREEMRKKFSCKKCGKRFLTEDLRDTHEQNCKTKVICLQCNRTFVTKMCLDKHVCPKRKKGLKFKKNYNCKKCPRVFENRSELYYHFLHNHTQRGRGQHPYPWGEEKNAPWMENGKLVDKELKKIYSKYSHLILRRSYAMNNSQGNWNWPIENGFTLEQLMGFVDELYKEQKRCH